MPTCNPCFTSLIESLNISLLPTYKPPLVWHMQEHSLPSSHNSKNARIILHLEPQLHEYSNIWPLRYRPKPCRPRTSKASKTRCLLHQKSPGTPHESPGAKGFQTVWRGTRVVRRQVPLMLLFPQASPSETILIIRRNTLQFSTGFVAIAWRSNSTARRYTSTCIILVFKHPKQSKINPFTFHIYSYPISFDSFAIPWLFTINPFLFAQMLLKCLFHRTKATQNM